MNKNAAKEIAKNISIKDIEIMLKNAKSGVKDWGKRSTVNKSLDIGCAWNLLASQEMIEALKNGKMKRTEILFKTNLVREFGEFLPDHLKPVKSKKNTPNLIHQKPIFK